ncbi:protein of unknown function [Lactiplantibacillus plantarum]
MPPFKVLLAPLPPRQRLVKAQRVKPVPAQLPVQPVKAAHQPLARAARVKTAPAQLPVQRAKA